MNSIPTVGWSYRAKGLLFLLLVAAGLAGNYFAYPIFLNIDFLFGSIFAMLALQFFGLRWGVLATALIASHTYVLWSHPYAIIIMTGEVAAVAWMMRFRPIGLVLADAMYWLLVGMPLAYLFYHGMMDVPSGNTSMVMIKQAVNGIANAILARLLFNGFVLGTRTGQVTYRDLIYNLLAFFALYPALILLMLAARSDLNEADRNVRIDLLNNSFLVNSRIYIWSQNMVSSVGKLAVLAARLNPSQMQAPLEQAYASNDNFLGVGLLGQEANIVAFSPLIDELGQSDLDRSFPNLLSILRMSQSLRPFFSEVVMGKIGAQKSLASATAQEPKPIVAVLAHVMNTSGSARYVAGILSMTQIQELLEKATQSGTMRYTLLDANGTVILTNRKDQTVMKPFVRQAGRLTQLDDAISQWVPTLAPNTPLFEKWKASLYVVDAPVGNSDEWRLILEQPMEPFLKLLYTKYTQQLMLLFALLVTALALAEFMSRKVSARIEQLSEFTKYLPNELANGMQPVWPVSNLVEHRYLIGNFKQMASALAVQFNANGELTASLEQRVLQRTQELTASERKYRHLIDNSHDIIYTLNTQGAITFVSRAWTTLLGHSVDDTLDHLFSEFVHPEDEWVITAALQDLFATGQVQTNIAYRVSDSEMIWHWHTSNASPIRSKSGRVTGFEGVAKDITVQRALEEEVRQLAFYDPLTKLPNRRLLDDRLSQTLVSSKRSACYGALVFLDLDKFKELNDTYGHAVGDLLLIEVSRRLTACVRKIDTVARFGGDEFVILLGELNRDKIESNSLARVIAEKIRVSLAEPYHLAAPLNGAGAGIIEHHCTASIGIVVFVSDQIAVADILKWADAAMYQAKVAGRNTIRAFEVASASSQVEVEMHKSRTMPETYAQI